MKIQGHLSFFNKLKELIDIRDFLVFGGLGLLGYGLYLKGGLWLGCVVCGVLFMTIGYLTGDK